MLDNTLTTLLQIKYPIIQAPMAGGITTSELVAEVSNAGGLGSIGAGYMSPSQIKQQIKTLKQLTSRPFSINLFVPHPFDVTEDELIEANEALNPIREKLNLHHKGSTKLPTYDQLMENFNEQIETIIEEKVPICSFTFGIPPNNVIRKLKQHHITLIGTATSVREAIEIEKAGMDLIVVQGSEAGGHRGSFLNKNENGIGLMSLIPQVVDKVTIPVIAAGGIMDGRGIVASLYLGAMGVQMGTAFLTCVESGASETFKEEILHTDEDEIVLTRSFSGKWARGINNEFIKEMKQYETSLLVFPLQNALTEEIRKLSTTQNNREYMSLWSGQSPRLAKKQTVHTLMEKLITETITLLKK